MKTRNIRLLLYLFLILCCHHLANAQTKSPVPESDYHLWGTLYYDNASPSGKWVSFVMRYAEHPDTLHVKHTASGKHYKFPSADAGRFLKDKAFVFQTGDTLNVLNLDRGTHKITPAVNKWDITSNGSALLMLDQQGNFRAQDANGKTLWEAHGVSLFNAAPNGSSVAYAQGNTAVLRNLAANAAPLTVATESAPFQNFSWSASGKALGFMNDHAGKIGLWYYQTASKKLTVFDTALLPETYTMASPATSRLTVSKDGKKVFFGMLGDWQTKQPQEKPVVEVWNGNDEFIYPEMQKKKGWEQAPRMAVWWPLEDKLVQIGTRDRAAVAFEGNEDYAITWSLTAFGPQYTWLPATNYYITNLSNGQTKIALSNVSSSDGQVSIAPSGRFVSYFKEGNYWRYDCLLDKHENLSSSLSTKWEYDLFGVQTIYGIVGWTKSAGLVVQDYNSVWLLERGKARRLAEGNGEKIWRLENTTPRLRIAKFDIDSGDVYDFESPLFFTWQEFNNNGISLRNAKGKFKGCVSGDFAIKSLRRVDGKLFYIKQRFDNPPTLYAMDSDIKSNLIYASNPQHHNYLWGKSEPFKYTTHNGKQVPAILFYPSNYQNGKNYPMIVRSYEDQFDLLHRYEKPTVFDNSGFCITSLNAHGYFVLVPNIEFGRNNPGYDILDGVESAVEVVLAKGMVNPKAVGYTGFSFGGYQAAFIATHSKLFATIIVGAGITDVVSNYLSISRNSGLPEIFRYENQLWHFDKPLYDMWETYERNSPIRNVPNVSGPLLIWASNGDPQVDWHQSIEFYLALRRLGKKSIFLHYPNEDHVLVKKPAQKDFNRRVLDWFDHHLKGEQKQWILDGTK